MPVRFRTVKLIAYAVRKQGGSISCQNCIYTLQLPDQEPQGPFNRHELIRWANQFLP